MDAGVFEGGGGWEEREMVERWFEGEGEGDEEAEGDGNGKGKGKGGLEGETGVQDF